MATVTAVGTKINTQKIQYRNNSNAFVLVFTEHYRLLEKEKEAGESSPGTSQNALDLAGLGSRTKNPGAKCASSRSTTRGRSSKASERSPCPPKTPEESVLPKGIETIFYNPKLLTELGKHDSNEDFLQTILVLLILSQQ